MTAVGMTLTFASFALGIWGYCLVKSYDVPFGALWADTWPGAQVNMTAPTAGHKLGTINNTTVET